MVIGMRQSFAKCKSKCVCDRTEPKPSPITDWSEPNPNWTLAKPKPNLNWKTDWNERRRNLQCRCKCRQSSPAVVRPTVHSEEKFRRKIYLHDPSHTAVWVRWRVQSRIKLSVSSSHQRTDTCSTWWLYLTIQWLCGHDGPKRTSRPREIVFDHWKIVSY